uniref:Uncharacterized protein n=1 Tax=Aegilops tauschii subsp. strangulata TaxID=200361 RepID=A0A453G4E5_AEGTS
RRLKKRVDEESAKFGDEYKSYHIKPYKRKVFPSETSDYWRSGEILLPNFLRPRHLFDGAGFNAN